jgi:hypothetical protein
LKKERRYEVCGGTGTIYTNEWHPRVARTSWTGRVRVQLSHDQTRYVMSAMTSGCARLPRRVVALSRCRPPCSLAVSRIVEMQPEILSDAVFAANETETVVLVLRRRSQVGELGRIFRRVDASVRRLVVSGPRTSARSKHPVVDRRQPRRDRQEQHNPHTEHDTDDLSRVHGLKRAVVATRTLSLGTQFELRD